MNVDVLAPFLGPDGPGQAILDGAMATELEKRGADIKDPLWSAKVLLEQPALIRDLHRDYFVAGADIAITASYQASFEGFAERGLGAREAAQLFRLSVRLACEAREQFLDQHAAAGAAPRPLVAASLGPFGAHLHDGSEYHGRYAASNRVIADFHRRRLDVLADTAADLIAAETIPGLREAELLLRVLEEFPDARAWLSFSCRDDIAVCHGERFSSAVAAASSSAQIVAVGVNCTAPQFVAGLLESAQGCTALPLLAYPNSGECWIPGENAWEPGGPAQSLAEAARGWKQAGARLIGGCCRTGVGDIAELAEALKG